MSNLSGALVVNKPSGMSSRDVAKKILRQFGKVKIGHVGTLDPLASGVLPILLGRCTRLADFFPTSKKHYLFTLKLGEETDSLDSTGKVIVTKPFSVFAREDIEAVLPGFLGKISQQPPFYSAIKFQGKPLYRYARQAETAWDMAGFAREVEIHTINLVSFETGLLCFEVYCGGGTYVRSLARDIAWQLGTVGHLVALERRESSGFGFKEAVALEEVLASSLEAHLIPQHKLPLFVEKWDCRELSDEEKLLAGRKIELAYTSLRLPELLCSKIWLAIDTAGLALGLVEVQELLQDSLIIKLKRSLRE